MSQQTDKLSTYRSTHSRIQLRRVLLRGTLCCLLAFSLCGQGCHQHNHGDGHGHGHGHGGNSETGETVSVTLFTQKTELFMEYNPLVAGRKASFLAHLTILGKAFQPVRKGRLTLHFMRGDQEVTSLVAAKPLRKGIFKPEGKAPPAGKYTLELRLTTGVISDVIKVDSAVVYSTVKAAKKANPKLPEDGNELSFLKEQQWKITFATELAKHRILRDGLSLPAECQALPSNHLKLTAPIAGKVGRIDPGVREGRRVKQGQQLFYIEPILFAGSSLPQLNQQIRAAIASLKLRQAQLKRIREMVKARAAGSWQLSELKHQISLHKAQLQTAKARRSLFFRSRRRGAGRAHAVVLRASFPGVLLKQHASQGAFVTQGQALAELASLKKIRIVAHLPEAYVHKAEQIQSAAYNLSPGVEKSLPKPHAIGATIDPQTRTLPLYFDFINQERFVHGQHISLRVHLSKQRYLAIPTSAVVDDRGTHVVFVQRGGESFIKKTVVTGVQDRGWTEIKAGLQHGERIVSRGAYELMLTIALKQQGTVGHGHAH